jgi:hypothetical protein
MQDTEAEERSVAKDSTWTIFTYSPINELDEMYNIIESNEGERIYPKGDSICQSLLDVFGSDIRENLNMKVIEGMWIGASPLSFLRWFMASTGSENLTIQRATGWSPIRSLMWTQDSLNRSFPYWSGRDLAKDKIKFLARKGASLHYKENDISLTRKAMYEAATFYLWCEILQELEIDIPSFFEEEIVQSPQQYEGWDNEGLTKLFRGWKFYLLNEDEYEWDSRSYCSNCECKLETFWHYYLREFQRVYCTERSRDHGEVEDDDKVDDEDQISDDEKMGNDVEVEDVEVDDDEVEDDEVEGDEVEDDEVEDDEVENDEVEDNDPNDKSDDDDDDDEEEEAEEVEEVDDDDETGDDDEIGNNDEVRHDDDETFVNRVYKTYKTGRNICKPCYEASRFMDEMQSLKLPMPGSFDP